MNSSPISTSRAGAAAAAQNVFDVDDGIIDHHAERHDEAAERHGVEAQSQGSENPDRRQQGERDRAEGNQRAAPVAQRDQQQRDHEHGADDQRIAQLLDRAFDEAGRPQQRRMVLHPLLGERRRERIEPLFQRPRDFERVGAELGRGLDQDARLAGDQGIAETRLGAFAQRGDIAETHRQIRRACRPRPAPAPSSVAPGACARITMRCVGVSR